MMSKSKLTLPLPLTLRFILNLRLAVIVSLCIQCYRFVWGFQLYLYSDFSLTISCDQRDSIGNWCNAGVSIVSKNQVFIGPEPDHSLRMSPTNWLTDVLVENWLKWLKYADYAPHPVFFLSWLMALITFHLFELWYLYFILWYQFDGIMTRHWAMQRRTT